MDIAAALPIKQPNRVDAGPSPASANDPYQDDFATELDAATGVARDEPTDGPRKAAGAKPKPNADAAEDKPAASAATDAQPQAAPTTALPVVAVQAAPPITPQMTESAVAEAAQSTPAPDKPTEAQTAFALASLLKPIGSAPALAGQAPAMAATASPTPETTRAPKPDAAAQPVANPETQGAAVPQALAAIAAPPVDASGQAKPAAGNKKTGDGKPDATAPGAQSAQAQTTAAAPTAAVTPPPAPNNQGGASKDGGDQRTAQGVHAAASAQKQTPATGQEFKPDAGAAIAATQPASQPAQNAAPAAPALIAQNAPVFVPPEALGVAIARKALDGVNKFELRLDPPELGRLDVSLEVDEAGHTRAHIRAERPEALELLQREAKGMEQALRQAGLNLDQSSLSFSLSGREGREAQEHAQHGRRAKFNAVLTEDEIHTAATRGAATQTNGVDLRV